MPAQNGAVAQKSLRRKRKARARSSPGDRRLRACTAAEQLRAALRKGVLSDLRLPMYFLFFMLH